MKCDIREKEKYCHELIAVSKSLEKDNIEEQKRINNLLSVERENQNRELRYLEQKDADIKMRDKKLIEREQKQDKVLIKSVAIVIVGVILIMISVLFIRGYLMSDNRTMNKYNKALTSYNEKIEEVNKKINEKNENLKAEENMWEQFKCDSNTETYGEFVCPEKTIQTLKSDIEILEEQKKELVKPQEPVL